MLETKDIAIIEAMRMGVDYAFPIKVRGFSIGVRPLSMYETVQVAARVVEELQKIPEPARNKLTEHTLYAKHTLVMASTSDVGKSDARITDLVLDRMTPDEVHFLFKSYVAACERVNPALELLTPAALQEVVATLKKKSSGPEAAASQLTELSFSELLSLAAAYLQTTDV